MPPATDDPNEQQIRDSWRDNAGAWTNAVRSGAIASRVKVTNEAVIAAVLDAAAVSGPTVIDIGCGEGWLVRALTSRGLSAVGVDGTLELIEQARAAGGRFVAAAYEELASTPHDDLSRANVAVCNFSLIGESSTDDVFRALPHLLQPHGRLVVQTLHPNPEPDDGPAAIRAEDGWREGSWRGFSRDFTRPAPWYFRTMDGWRRLFAEHGLTDLAVREPADPDTGRPASVVFTARME